jgi:hypothetical protein
MIAMLTKRVSDQELVGVDWSLLPSKGRFRLNLPPLFFGPSGQVPEVALRAEFGVDGRAPGANASERPWPSMASGMASGMTERATAVAGSAQAAAGSAAAAVAAATQSAVKAVRAAPQPRAEVVARVFASVLDGIRGALMTMDSLRHMSRIFSTAGTPQPRSRSSNFPFVTTSRSESVVDMD